MDFVQSSTTYVKVCLYWCIDMGLFHSNAPHLHATHSVCGCRGVGENNIAVTPLSTPHRSPGAIFFFCFSFVSISHKLLSPEAQRLFSFDWNCYDNSSCYEKLGRCVFLLLKHWRAPTANMWLGSSSKFILRLKTPWEALLPGSRPISNWLIYIISLKTLILLFSLWLPTSA